MALALLCLALPSSLLSQPDSNEPFILRYADSLLGITLPTGFIRELHGNVSMAQGKSTITCDKAIHYVEENRADLFGNVIFRRDSLVITAPVAHYNGGSGVISGEQGITLTDSVAYLEAERGTYSTETTIARFRGNVRLETDSLLLFGDTLRYNRTNQHSFVRGKALAQSKANGSKLYAGRLYDYPDSGTSIALLQPLLMQFDTTFSTTATVSTEIEQEELPIIAEDDEDTQDSTSSLFRLPMTTATIERIDTLFISADTLLTQKSSSGATHSALRNVQILRGGIAAIADVGIYLEEQEEMHLSSTATIWSDSTELSADTIIVYFSESKLRKIYAVGDAFSATTSQDTLFPDRRDQLSGTRIELLYDEEGVLSRILAIDEASSLFFQYAEEQTPDGAIRHVSDTIVVVMHEGELEDVFWLRAVEGEFFPEPIARAKMPELKLPNFRMREKRPISAVFTAFIKEK